MKKLIAASAIGFLFLIPVISYAQPGQNIQKAPPVSQGLVREGDFAAKLVEVLKLGTAKNEAEAESMLASAGIAPKNGWIANHPLTPDIIGEVRKTIGLALDSGKIAMNKGEALMAVQILIDNQWRMPVAPGEEQARQYGEYPPPVYGEYEGEYEPYYYPYYYPYYPYYYPYPYYGGFYGYFGYGRYYRGGWGGRGGGWGGRGGGGGGGSHGGGGHGGGGHGGGR
jgi:hypothetical protein